MRCEFLPPYSPDYNPIELAFSTIKADFCHHLPTLEHDSKTGNELVVLLAIHDSVFSVTFQDALGTGGEGTWKQVGTRQEHWRERNHLSGMFPLDTFQAHIWCSWHILHTCDHQSQVKCSHYVSTHSMWVTSLSVKSISQSPWRRDRAAGYAWQK